jgi:uncharacterized membrane protein
MLEVRVRDGPGPLSEVVAMMWYWSGGVHWWGWLLGFVGMVAFWGLIVWGIWYLVTGASRQPHQGRDSGKAQRILDERLARAEISPEEYERLRDLIRGDGVSAHNGWGGPVAAGDRRCPRLLGTYALRFAGFGMLVMDGR